jgi:hypothetical protein
MHEKALAGLEYLAHAKTLFRLMGNRNAEKCKIPPQKKYFKKSIAEHKMLKKDGENFFKCR